MQNHAKNQQNQENTYSLKDLTYQNLIKQADLERYKNITSRNKNVTEITTQWINQIQLKKINKLENEPEINIQNKIQRDKTWKTGQKP